MITLPAAGSGTGRRLFVTGRTRHPANARWTRSSIAKGNRSRFCDRGASRRQLELTCAVRALNLLAFPVTKRSDDPAPEPPGGRAAGRLRLFREQRGLPDDSPTEPSPTPRKPEPTSQKKASPDEKKE